MLLAPLKATVLGSYAPDRYFIQIHRQPGQVGPTTPDPLVFIHEYWHYLQNLTTLHGIKSFETTQHLLAAFSRTLDQDGSSRGSAALSPELQEYVARFLEWRRAWDGDLGRDHDQDVVSRVVAVDGSKVEVELRWPGTHTTEREALVIGATAIKESAAHLVEGEVARLLGRDAPRSPEFPYSLLTRIFEHVAGGFRDSPLVIAALGTLALLSHAPGSAVLPLFQRYWELRSTMAAADALAMLYSEKVEPELRQAAAVIKETDLPSILDMHRGRGASEKAVEFLVGECVKGIARRLQDPLFDLRPLLDPQHGEDPVASLITQMTEGFVPCDMSFDGKVLSFHDGTEDELGLDLSQYLRSFHAQQEFVMMHVRGGGFVASAELSRPCPYYSVCSHPFRSARETECRTSPWRIYTNNTPGCWFTNGVSATLGPTTIRKV